MTSPDAVVAEVVRGRRTINEFQDEPPPRERIVEAIDLARWAPNHKHTEPWCFHLLGPETVAAIVDLNARLVAEKKGLEAGEAKRLRWSKVPGWLVVTCTRTNDPLREREDYAACCCAIQNLQLVLWTHDIGVKWTTGDVTRHRDFASLLDIDPAERSIVGLLWYGYPAKIPDQKRKPVGEIFEERP